MQLHRPLARSLLPLSARTLSPLVRLRRQPAQLPNPRMQTTTQLPAKKYRVFSRSTTPLVWIDCEMTGLDPTKDHIIQICCFVTDSNMTFLSPEPFDAIINAPDEILDGMDEWCTRMHASTGLTANSRASRLSIETAAGQLCEYIRSLVPNRNTGMLAGNSVHFDKAFLEKWCPQVVDYLNYRIVDVSTVKEAARMWCSQDVWGNVPRKEERHEAKSDILESIEEMKYYKEKLFDGK